MTIKFFKVGGAVRDDLLGLKSKDVDFAVECESFDKMRSELVRRGAKIFVETPEFLTIRAKMEREFPHLPKGLTADFVLCRKDSDTGDGRRPDFVTPGTILDDLARRDFSVNAMAFDCETGEMLDPHCGANDCRLRVIRCVGVPLHRFREDGLRVFRALRFAVTKEFSIAENTQRAMRKIIKTESSVFVNVSTERIREELLKMFAKDSARSFSILSDFKLLPLVVKRGIWFEPTTRQKP